MKTRYVRLGLSSLAALFAALVAFMLLFAPSSALADEPALQETAAVAEPEDAHDADDPIEPEAPAEEPDEAEPAALETPEQAPVEEIPTNDGSPASEDSPALAEEPADAQEGMTQQTPDDVAEPQDGSQELVVAAEVAAAAPVAAAKQAAAKTAAAPKAGWYSLASLLKSTLLIQVKNSGSKTGTKLLMKKAGATTGQAFKLVKSGKYWRLMSGVGFKARVAMDKRGNVFLSTDSDKTTLFKLVSNADGSYRLVNVKYKKALAIQGGKAKSGAYLVGQKSSATNKAQAFNLVGRTGLLNEGIYSMRTWLGSKYAVAPKGSSLAKGKKAALVKYSKGMAQKWQVKAVPGKTNVYTLECIATGYRLSASGTKVSLQAASGAKNQMWKVIAANGQVVWKNMSTKKALQVKGGLAKKNAAVVGAKYTKKDDQRFTMKYAAVMESGFYELDSAANGSLALEVAGASDADGAAVQVAADANQLQQRWYYDKASKTLSNASSGKVLAAKGGKVAKGSAVVQTAPDGSAAQTWTFQYVGGGKFRLVSGVDSSIALNAAGTKAGSKANLAKASSSAQQGWTVRQDKMAITSTYTLSFTLDQMAKWQKAGNSYLSSYTAAQLKKVLNPANGSQYKFLDLRRSTGLTAAQLDAFILTGGKNGKLKGLGSVFVEAAKKYNLNEVYLLAHAIWESGWGTSMLAGGYKYSGGTIDGKKYKAATYYNFYGIGAYDSSPLSGGRKMAIINGWTSPSKAVTGAAKWIASNYVYTSSYAQRTLYDIKWDTQRTKAIKGYGWHQYATDPNWAEGIAGLMGSCFKLAKTTTSMVFIKPVYQ